MDEYQSGLEDDLVVGDYGNEEAADFLADFDNFDSFEKLAFCEEDEDEEEEEEEEDEEYKPSMKRSKFDSESSEENYFLKKEASLDQIMWNGGVKREIKEERIEVEQVDEDMDAAAMLLMEDDEEEDPEEVEKINCLRAAFVNDHSYAQNCNNDVGIVIKQEEIIQDHVVVKTEKIEPQQQQQQQQSCSSNSVAMLNFDKMGIKKTKILVPLKDLMESLQQKSYLVSPLGPGKKIITLTNGETVKGELLFFLQ